MQELSSTRRKINEHCGVKDKFPPDAYEFVTACVIEQVNALEQPRHLSALELLQGIQKQFIDNFGPLAEMVVDKPLISGLMDSVVHAKLAETTIAMATTSSITEATTTLVQDVKRHSCEQFKAERRSVQEVRDRAPTPKCEVNMSF